MEKKTGEKKKDIIIFIVATNVVVVASRRPNRRPTGTPTARANIKIFTSASKYLLWLGGITALHAQYNLY